MLLIGFPDYREPARKLAQELGSTYVEVDLHHFPDGESRLIIDTSLPAEVIICRSLDRPNHKLIELMLLCQHLRQNGVQQITLVAPYLCYMRQDKAFHPGEIVSQTIIAGFISQQVDKLVTVDPHLHRISHLSEAYPHIDSTALSARDRIVDYLRQYPDEILLMGPDSESEQWVAAIAAATQRDYVVADKIRHDDRSVSIQLPDQTYSQQHIVLIDDVVSTGHTLAKIASQLIAMGAAQIDCIVTHPLFSGDALDTLKTAGINRIISTDTILHESNQLSMMNDIARVLIHDNQ